MIGNPSIWGALRDAAGNGVFSLVGNGTPLSGIAGTGTGVGVAGKGCLYTDLDTGNQFFNEGDATTPYWTPTSYYQRGLLSCFTDFRDLQGIAVASTAASTTLSGSGLRIFGSGIEETDSGLTVAMGEDGPVGSLISSATSGKIAAISALNTTTSAGPFQPDTNGVLTVDSVFAVDAALTSRSMFIGFLGTWVDAMLPPVTGATVTLTLVQDDLAGLVFDSGLTAATELFAPHNKSDEAATILTTATGVDTGTVIPAFGTYVRLRVQISATGVMTCFRNKVQVTQISAALDADEETSPVLLVRSLASATKAILIRSFGTWAARSAA